MTVIFVRKGDGSDFIHQFFRFFPASAIQKAPIIERTRAILADPDSSAVPRLEAEINQIIYALYELGHDDIKRIEEP